jgi:FkbM family methyltransferase
MYTLRDKVSDALDRGILIPKVLGSILSRPITFSGRDIFSRFSRSRRLVKEFVDTLRTSTEALASFGNYSIFDDENLGPDSVIYSFGVGTNVSFDEELVTHYGCRVHLFDPTPVSVVYMEQHPLTGVNFRFEPVGVADREGEMTFYLRFAGGSYTLFKPKWRTIDTFQARCLTLDQIMSSSGHSNIDLLKMDIEGAALPVMWDMKRKGIRPQQIVVELEVPAVGDVEEFLENVGRLVEAYEQEGYEIVHLPRNQYNYYSVELLMRLREREQLVLDSEGEL